MSTKGLIGAGIAGILLCVIAVSVSFLRLSPSADMKLQVTESSWSGRSDEGTPEETVREYELEQDKELVLTYAESDGKQVVVLSFTITKIGSDSVQIRTNTPMCIYSEGGIDLGTDKTVFSVTRGEPLKLVTPTTDAGDIYRFELE